MNGWRCWVLAAGLACAAAGAVDRTKDWRFMAILQPQLDFVEGRDPDFVWRRVRALAGGPITDNLKAKVQIDWSHEKIHLLDGYLEYQPIRSPVRFTVRGGMQYPDWAHEGVTFPDTVNYAYIVTTTNLHLRNAGVTVAANFLGAYEISAGVFNGEENFNDRNGTPNYIATFTTAQHRFDARGWYLKGKDPAPGGEDLTDLVGAELTNIRFGRTGGEVAYIAGRRYGRRVQGAYVQADYWLTDRDAVWLKFDWADQNRGPAAAERQRYIVSYHHRFRPWLDTLWDVEYDQRANAFSAFVRGDIRF